MFVMFAVIAAPAAAQRIPTMIADKSKAKSPSAPIEPGVRGYGTRGVEGSTLAEMKARCVEAGSLDAVKAARCDQLRRTLKTAPGNAQ